MGGTVISLASLAIAAIVAAAQIQQWWQDKRSARKAQLLAEANAGASRDSLIVGSAEAAVRVLEQALRASEKRCRDLEAELEAERRKH